MNEVEIYKTSPNYYDLTIQGYTKSCTLAQLIAVRDAINGVLSDVEDEKDD